MYLENALILINGIRQLRYKPNPWEKQFIEYLEIQRPERLTKAQSDKIQEIYRKAAGGGRYVERENFSRKPRYYDALEYEEA